jgi:hypothetical protein
MIFDLGKKVMVNAIFGSPVAGKKTVDSKGVLNYEVS